MSFGNITNSTLVVSQDLIFDPGISQAAGTKIGTVYAYGPLADGINVYDIVTYKDKGQSMIEQTNSQFVLVEFEDVLIINKLPV